MALHLNFYHEIHKQSERERRDPVKLASLAALVVALCLALWYFYRLSVVGGVEARCNETRRAWAALEPKGKAAVEKEAQLLALQKSNQALVERLHGRFYWAPFLEKFAAATPPFVQIVSLSGDLDAGKEKKRTVTVLVRGLAAGAQPRTAAETYRRSLQESLAPLASEVSAVFDGNSLEDGADTVQLDGQTLGTASFRIRVQFIPKP
ncbi:MAG: hypothetical protein WCH57_02325 [Verrucomicrobiota bacterium]